MRPAADLRLRMHGRWDRLRYSNKGSYFHLHVVFQSGLLPTGFFPTVNLYDFLYLTLQQCAPPITCPVNTLNAELNSICHLLVLLGNLTFMGPCIVSIFQ
jgi:hypothetical protein